LIIIFSQVALNTQTNTIFCKLCGTSKPEKRKKERKKERKNKATTGKFMRKLNFLCFKRNESGAYNS
jgi:hypothetical protein